MDRVSYNSVETRVCTLNYERYRLSHKSNTFNLYFLFSSYLTLSRNDESLYRKAPSRSRLGRLESGLDARARDTVLCLPCRISGVVSSR